VTRKKKKRTKCSPSRHGREYEVLSGGWSGVGKWWPKIGSKWPKPTSYSDRGVKGTITPFGGDWTPEKAFASTLPPKFDPKRKLHKTPTRKRRNRKK